jgi:hypothetical protein
VADPKNKEEVRSRAAADGIEFFFAQFVDMHGKPSAKPHKPPSAPAISTDKLGSQPHLPAKIAKA